MRRRVRMNRDDPTVPYLSDIVPGGVMADNSDGVVDGTSSLNPYQRASDPEFRDYGNRSGKPGPEPVEEAGD